MDKIKQRRAAVRIVEAESAASHVHESRLLLIIGSCLLVDVAAAVVRKCLLQKKSWSAGLGKIKLLD